MPLPVRDVTMPMRAGKVGRRPLARAFEQPGGRKPGLQLHEAFVECAEAREPHALDVQLELAARFVDRSVRRALRRPVLRAT